MIIVFEIHHTGIIVKNDIMDLICSRRSIRKFKLEKPEPQMMQTVWIFLQSTITVFS